MDSLNLYNLISNESVTKHTSHAMRVMSDLVTVSPRKLPEFHRNGKVLVNIHLIFVFHCPDVSLALLGLRCPGLLDHGGTLGSSCAARIFWPYMLLQTHELFSQASRLGICRETPSAASSSTCRYSQDDFDQESESFTQPSRSLCRRVSPGRTDASFRLPLRG